ncbi:MAG: adenylate/guanylate cyclase domain-containing protein [Verrucomicrobiia bacterium]|jgi:class 3 adenylate cyclase
MRGPSFSFRIKLVAAMMLIVVGVTGATLYVAQDRMRASHERLSNAQFKSQVDLFSSMRDARLVRIREKCSELVRSVRVAAALEEEDLETLYLVAFDELAEVLRQRTGTRSMGRPARLVRFIDTEGKELPPPKGQSTSRKRGNGIGVESMFATEELKAAFAQVAKAMEGEGEAQKIGYVERVIGARSMIMEVIVTKVILRADDEYMGALVVGFPAADGMEEVMNRYTDIRSGIWVNGEIFSKTLDEGELPGITEAVTAAIRRRGTGSGVLTMDVGAAPHKVFFQQMSDSEFLPAYRVAIYSLAEAAADQGALRARVLAFAGILLIGALGLSLLVSHSFSTPIRALVGATRAVQKGDFDVRLPVRNRDEIGQLTASFNEMTEGLKQKEKYRAVLDMVADKDVAEQMMQGSSSLGGELRDISVLFCDIRGFTAMTQDMPPKEVIDLMNDHFTAMTNVVYEHDGVVDKFVGDLIMGVFGAPKSYGNDAHNAARCCVRMIQEREKMNETAEQSIHVGIGLASGEAVAGCMGSEDRLNYTVMGARVNLSSRLCSVAGRDETVIDQGTYELLKDYVEVEALPELQVKGFNDPVQAYRLLGVRSLPESAPEQETQEVAPQSSPS